MTLLLFWLCIALVAYGYAGFPLLICLRGLVWRRPYREADIEPAVSIIIAVHNERAVIADKLQNVLALDYPRRKLEILIASDGSDDGTNHTVRQYSRQGVELLELPRKGKFAALNAAVARSSGDVLVFSDANSMWAPHALKWLVRPLADPHVGGVAGDQRYRHDPTSGNVGERTYWSLDRWMKRLQSDSGNVISATGAIYCIRRELFQQVPPSVTDDFAVSTGVIARGYRLVFAPQAVAWEPSASRSGLEFGRKVRIATRGLRSVIFRRGLFHPWRHGFYSVQLFSHKVVRRLVAIPLLLLLLLCPWAWSWGWLYQMIVAAQLAFYACAAVGLALDGTRWGRCKPLALPAYFSMANVAVLVACWNLLCGRRIDVWRPRRETTFGHQETSCVSAVGRGT